MNINELKKYLSRKEYSSWSETTYLTLYERCEDDPRYYVCRGFMTANDKHSDLSTKNKWVWNKTLGSIEHRWNIISESSDGVKILKTYDTVEEFMGEHFEMFL
jgi:hypothetical protein